MTSHNLAMAVRLVKTELFETVQFPFNFIEPEAGDELHQVARERNIGIIAMKPFAGGVIDDAVPAFKFLRRYPDVIPIPGYDSVAAVDQVVALYEQPNEVTAEDLALMDKYRERGGAPVLPALRILPALPERGADHPGHGLPDSGQAHVTGCGGQLRPHPYGERA